jgi:hypothetical protein
MNHVNRHISMLPLQARKVGLLAWIIISVLGMACRQSSGVEDVVHTRDPLAPDLVVMATSTPILQSTVTLASPVETMESISPNLTPATDLPVNAGSLTPASQPCSYDYFFEPSPDVCPTSAPQYSAAAEQPFERGFMIWLEGTNEIIVFDWDGRWQRFEDTFVEGQQENDPALVAPVGLYQPVRGFGKVWRENPQVKDQLGWALGRELGYESAFQEQQDEAEELTISFIRAFNGQILALIPRSLQGGDWVIAAS